MKEKFLSYIKNDIRHNKSYKLVLYKGFFELASNGQVEEDKLVDYFRNFYLDRKKQGLRVEVDSARDLILNIDSASFKKIRNYIERMPLKRMDYLRLDDGFIIIDKALWDELSQNDIANIKRYFDEEIQTYYQQELGAGMPNNEKFMFHKKVNWSMFKWGFTIPLEHHDDFYIINNDELESGKAHEIKFLIKNKEFSISLRNLGRKAVNSTFQIRYDGNEELKELLRAEFNFSYQYIKEERERQIKKEGKQRPQVNVPDDNAEYIKVYSTGQPYVYKIKFFSAKEDKEELKEMIREDNNNKYVKDVEMIGKLSVKDNIKQINNYITSKGFTYPEGLIENFYLSLKTKPFVLLAGISGTGKTKLIQLFAEAINCNEENGRFKLISVRPDWSDSSDLLGYNDLKGNFKAGPMINIIKQANEDRDNIYMVCLDEMNLARVEYYFSDLLSVMETRKKVNDRIQSKVLLEDEEFIKPEDKKKYGGLYLPDNLYIVGTVNMDETTHPFSKKVLDRANTIEFSEINLDSFNLDQAEGKVIMGLTNYFLRPRYVTLNDCEEDNYDSIQQVIDQLKEINEILKLGNLQVGYRVRDEISFYMLYNEEYNLIESNLAFDFQLMQKILPRIQGSSSLIKEILMRLLAIAAGKDYSIIDGRIGDQAVKYTNDDSNEIKYPKSAQKLAYMIKRFEEDGFTSYWL